MIVERMNGILDKTNKLWYGETNGVETEDNNLIMRKDICLEILEDRRGKTTIQIGDDVHNYCIDLKDVKKLISTYEMDKNNANRVN